MNINLYKTTDDENVLNKTLTDQYSFTINARSDFDILDPIIILNTNEESVDLQSFNYLELVDFNRFYFIESTSMLNASLIELTCTVDVLETYKAELLTSELEYRRSFKPGDYVGSDIEYGSDYIITTQESDMGFTEDKTLILSTIGGSSGSGSGE